MELQALAIDLDGTLLSRDESVSERNQAAVRAALDAGWQLIIATARWYQLAEEVAGIFGVRGPVIACSGAEVRRLSDGADLFDVRLPLGFAEDLYAICDHQRCVAWIALDKDVLIKMDGQPDSSALPASLRYVPSLADASLGPDGRVAPRIALIQGSEVIKRILEELVADWSRDVRFVQSFSSRGRTNLALTATGADKGVALAVACADLGLLPQQVVAIGDAQNDIEMFRVAGGSFAMGQADDEVKAAASAVTAPNDQDGVAQAIERLLAEGRRALEPR
jgi:Cof subfamily protein (haloacid dehalogenase superfamily)